MDPRLGSEFRDRRTDPERNNRERERLRSEGCAGEGSSDASPAQHRRESRENTTNYRTVPNQSVSL
jgi:hypothetical protein